MIDSLGITFTSDHEYPLYQFPKAEEKKELFCFENPFKKISQWLTRFVICPFVRSGGSPDFYTRITGNYDTTLKPVTLREGEIELDALTIIPYTQRMTPPEKQRWLVFALPNGATHDNFLMNSFLKQLSILTGLCIGITNYRGSRPDASCLTTMNYKDLVDDVDSFIKHLTVDMGVRPAHIVMHGLSLGGIVGIEVASRHQKPGEEMHYLGENTLNNFQEVALEIPFSKSSMNLAQKILFPKHLPHKTYERITTSLKQIALIIPTLIARVILFSIFFFEALFSSEWEKAGTCLFEIGKSIVLPHLLLGISIIQLATFPFWDLTQHLADINLYYADKLEDTLFYRMMRSRVICSLVKKFISFSGWESDGKEAWNKIRGEKLISQVKSDEIIPFAASLYRAVNDTQKQYLHQSPTSGHNTFLVQENPRLFFNFLERALKIQYNEKLKSVSGQEISRFLWQYHS